ncbi:MAG: diguanylate cyclase [Pegethrix bostrychoides GSE-TBD4-15B]|jgi:diguanylate cyclase (GGDEF)-like protein|uniref:Diguanylate cyclase n=1 Tax=Pegethrix bostrychoides GSE-TBD4-15B TaxID=2839662 RepID=A0A951PEQ8_9CYAN|nr:diguanylate cyclase [Pegethrix bostrychoides GSE-TBD4-15B]
MAAAKILVVDDEIELQRLIQQRFGKQIQAQTLDFIFASNGIEALRTLQQDQQIDMVLTDINMPAMDGLDFIHCLPKISETLKAVVISAYDDISYMRQAMNEGAFDFLVKPLDFQDLERTIHKTLKFVQQLKDKQLATLKLQEDLRQVAFQDALTGLPNRAWLDNHLRHVFKQRKQPQNPVTALLFIDLDGFKQVNDRFGHAMGDLLLKQVAERLKLCLREGDLAARLGGDEFVILLDAVPEVAVAVAIAERVRLHLAKPFELEQAQAVIGASIGIALSQKQHENPDALLREADLAMYAAKAQGKGCVVVAPDLSLNLSPDLSNQHSA